MGKIEKEWVKSEMDGLVGQYNEATKQLDELGQKRQQILGAINALKTVQDKMDPPPKEEKKK
jgi:hypothetical protein